MKNLKLLDCTLRDGGYYNKWAFCPDLVAAYLKSMAALKVDYIEIGLRTLQNKGFKGGFAFSTDRFLQSLHIPNELEGRIGVMVNASELVAQQSDLDNLLKKLFAKKSNSPVSLVRIASHFDEFEISLPVASWLKEHGYKVGFNLMQIADRSDKEISYLAELANSYPVDVLYFADSMGSLFPHQVTHIVNVIRQSWNGEIGIHTHDNMVQALANSEAAIEAGVSWVDATVTGMGRGPGNAQTEYVALAFANYREQQGNITLLLEAIRNHFKPLQAKYCWGTNPYYYLAGRFGIHPTYIQDMLSDSRFSDEDILAALQHLKVDGGKKYSSNNLDAARNFYAINAKGCWNPQDLFKGRDVLLLGAGPGVKQHCEAIADFIRIRQPIVLALNTQSSIHQELIDVRIACNPVRLLADCEAHVKLPQPLILPASMLPFDVFKSLHGKILYDYGIQVQEATFQVHDYFCTIPTMLVIAYALAVLASGQAQQVYLAGFDGFGADDPRRQEVDEVFQLYKQCSKHIQITSLTPTLYDLDSVSIYGI